MPTAIKMPQPGNTVEECILVSWIASKGARVSTGELVAEIETDKANFELEAPVDGVLLETFFDEGALVPVLTNICVIGEPGEDVEEFRPKNAVAVAAPPVTAPRPESAPAAAPVGPAQPGPVAQPGSVAAPALAAAGVLSPRARRFAEEHDFLPANLSGSGPGGRVLEADIRAVYETSPRVSSLAREMMKDGYRPRGNGAGIGGMLLARNLLDPPVKMSRTRETIARRMRESLTVTAQYTMHASADATGLLALRQKIKAAAIDHADANLNDMVMFCAVRTLIEVPTLNAELIGGEIFQHQEINLGFACDTERGLMVPVVKGCRNLSLADLARAIHRLSDQAVNGSLGPDDMAGGTFTVSNLGGLGVESFTPIVNPPQVAILGVNTIQLKPVRRDGEVVFVDHIGFSLTCDHQVIDGAPGARFLQRLKQNIEHVEALAGL